MSLKLKKLAAIGTIGVALLVAPGIAAADGMQGIIIDHVGQVITLRGGGSDTKITLTDSTKIQAVSGVFGGQREDHPPSDLIAGLAVNVETAQNGDELDATKITFKPNDFKTAMAAQAAMHPEKEKLAAARAKLIATQKENERRMSLIGQYDQKAMTRVFFATGSATINAAGRQALNDIIAQSASIPGGQFKIVGHTDTTGSAAANQRLSDQRASAVTAYLATHGVPSSKIISSTGLGEDVALDSADLGGAKNRRVTVFIMVSKAAEGPSQVPPDASATPPPPSQ